MDNINLKRNYYYGNQRSEMLQYVNTTSKNILDVGCGYGGFLELVKENISDIETWGIEVVEEVSGHLNNRFDFVLNGSVENQLENLPDQYFDTIVFNDVLEHLLYPTDVLLSLKKKLSIEGQIVSSIPNVIYARNIYNMIAKKDWKYEDSGILDKTHFRFFTKKSIIRMFEEAGYEIISINGIFRLTDLRYRILNFLTLGYFDECMFERFACIAKIKNY